MRPTSKNRLLPAALVLCTTAACVSTPKIIGPPPPYEPCPAGSLETHARLGLKPLNKFHVELEGYPRGHLPMRVRSGPMSTKVLQAAISVRDAVPLKSIINGRLYVREGIVYGRFTELVMPGQPPLPVCLDMRDMRETAADLGALTNEGKREDPLIPSDLFLVVVERFEQDFGLH